MTVMGFSAQPTESSVASKHQKPSEAAPRYSRSAYQTTPYEEEDDAQLAESFETMASIQGRGHKRSKGHCRSNTGSQKDKVPALSPNCSNSENLERHITRKALGETSFNCSGKQHLVHPSKNIPTNAQEVAGADENYTPDVDLDMDLTFSRDSMFTSLAVSDPINRLDSQN